MGDTPEIFRRRIGFSPPLPLSIRGAKEKIVNPGVASKDCGRDSLSSCHIEEIFEGIQEKELNSEKADSS